MDVQSAVVIEIHHGRGPKAITEPRNKKSTSRWHGRGLPFVERRDVLDSPSRGEELIDGPRIENPALGQRVERRRKLSQAQVIARLKREADHILASNETWNAFGRRAVGGDQTARKDQSREKISLRRDGIGTGQPIGCEDVCENEGQDGV